MGADMYAGGDSRASLHLRKACSLVNHWCSEFDTRPPLTPMEAADASGSYDITIDMVASANAVVPDSPAAIRSAGLAHYDASDDDLRYAREFLREVADAGEGIGGSY